MIHLFGVSKCIVFDTTICPKANIGEGFQFPIFRNISREYISAAARLHVKTFLAMARPKGWIWALANLHSPIVDGRKERLAWN